MKGFESRVTIEAPPEAVWEVLLDTARWPEWDPFCDAIDGQPALGTKLKVYRKLSPGRAFPVKVTTLDPPTRMVWTGGMPLGLFRGERTFTLTAAADRTDFELREVFSGPMLALIGRSLPDMTEAFDAFTAGLKSRVEGR
jgi:hypothetical protein